MAKGKKKGRPSKTSTKRHWILIVGVMLVMGGGGYWWWQSRQLTVPALGVRLAFVLPATPRNPREATLPPGPFRGKVAEAYRTAWEVPELVERMPCYCGCYKTNTHQNNLDCYIDTHAAG